MLLLCGCSGYKEINNGYLVTAISFEKSGEESQILLKVLLPENEDESLILSGSGSGFDEAFSMLLRTQAKSLYFEHCGVLAIKRDTPKNEIEDILSFCHKKLNAPAAMRAVYCDDTKSVFDADKTGYDVITLINNNGIKYENRLYALKRKINDKADFSLPMVSARDNTVFFEGEVQ